MLHVAMSNKIDLQYGIITAKYWQKRSAADHADHHHQQISRSSADQQIIIISRSKIGRWAVLQQCYVLWSDTSSMFFIDVNLI
jgi:hypothetical protein